MRLGLGTAQFGLDYGVSNRGGRTPTAEALSVLDLAVGSGIDLLDTAAAYGDAETVLAEAKAQARGFRIVTKTISLSNGLEAVLARADRSLDRLGRPLDTMMVHAAGDLLAGDGPALWASLRAFQDEGAVRRLGISFYPSDPIADMVARMRPEVVQLPASLVDQRLIRSGVVEQLAQQGVEVHVRSVFHQGLIFVDPDRLPPSLQPKREIIARWQARLRQEWAPLHLAVSFLTTVPGIHAAIVGVTRAAELRDILDAMRRPWPGLDADAFALDDPLLLNPTRW